MAEIVGVSSQFTVAVDVAAMEREGAAEYGHGWSVASLLALVGDLLERGYGSVLYRELMAVRELSRESLERAQGRLGPHGALIRVGLEHPVDGDAAHIPGVGPVRGIRTVETD